jgi:hypothetical protein
LLAFLAALLVFVPGGLAAAGPAQARTAARNDCQDAAQVFGMIGTGIGIVPLPLTGQASNLLNLLSGIGGNWLCGGQNAAQMMMEIARQQAQLVFDENMVKIFGAQVDNQMTTLGSMEELVNPTDDDYEGRVDKLNAIWRALEGIEPVGGNLTFAALPAMTALAGTKMATLTLAMETEKTRLQNWRDLGVDRVREARESLTYLDGLKAKLDKHISDRFARYIETFEPQCGIVHCVSRARIYTRDHYLRKTLYDSGVMSWSGIIAPNPTQQPEYQNALARANTALNNGRAAVRNAYVTPDFERIRAGLQAHIAAPNPKLFHLRKPRCSEGQFMILQSVTHDFLTVTARDGISDGTSLWLLGDLDYAKAHDGSQFTPKLFGDSFLYEVRGVELTMHADGGSQAGNLIRLHGDENFATHHPESLFQTYITANNQLIFKVSDQDLTIGLSGGEHTHSQLVLDKPLAAAVNDTSSRFRFACYPNARP